MDYIFYSTDESFDYNGPFGTATHYQIGLHGFSLDFDKDYKPILEEIKGFGEFDDIEDKVATYQDLLDYLSVNLGYLDYNCEEATSQDDFDELISILEECILEEKENGEILKEVC